MAEVQKDRPRFSRGMFYIAVIGLVLLGIAGFVFSQRGEESAVNIASGDPAPLPVNTRIAERSETLLIKEQYTGLVSARRSSALGFEAGGRIETISVDVGDVVEAGDILAELDTSSLKADLAAAKAQISGAEASLKLARSTVERQTLLEEKGLLSAQRFDEAEAQADAAIAQLNVSKAQAASLQVRIDLSRLKAPFGGVVTKRYMDEGTIAGAGAPVLVIVESSQLETSIGLPSSMARSLEVGKTYDLRVDDVLHPASLRSVTGVIDNGQRTVTAVFDLGSESSAVYPGAVARLELEQSLPQSGYWVPVAAMTEADRGMWSIFVVTEDADGEPVVEKRLVDVLHPEADRAFVRGALQSGDEMVLNGLHRLTAGMRVKPIRQGPSD